MSKVVYRAGDWFAIPLSHGRFAPGRVVLHRRPHNVLVYVFAPRPQLPTLDELARLEPGDALVAQHISGLHIGDPWPLLGGGHGFDRRGWKIPEFESDVRHAFPPGREVRVAFLDDQLRTTHSFQAPLSELGKRQQDGVAGAAAFERWLEAKTAAGALVPLRTQQWWDQPAPLPAGVAAAAVSVGDPDRVVVVVPGGRGAAADLVEMTLMLELDPRLGEVDGTTRSSQETHVTLYGRDGRRLADRVVELVRPLHVAGLRLLVRVDDHEWTLTPEA